MSQGINNNEVVASKSRRIVKNLRWWVLVLFLLGVTVNYITRNSLGILAPELKTSMGITTEQYSWIVGAFQLAYTVFQPLCGWLIDVIGLKVGFMICAIIWALACIFHAGAEAGCNWLFCASRWGHPKRPPRQRTPKRWASGSRNQSARLPQVGLALVSRLAPCWHRQLSILPMPLLAGRARLCLPVFWRWCGCCCGGRFTITRKNTRT
jgi:ACS family hexuronate transporter-like MFS transporter